MAHATNDLNAVEESAGVGIMTLVDSLIAGLTVLFAMIFVVSGKLTLLAMLPFPILVWATNRYGILLHRRFGTAQQTFSNLNEETREAIAGIRAVKAHQLTRRQLDRFERLSDESVDANRLSVSGFYLISSSNSIVMPSKNIRHYSLDPPNKAPLRRVI